MCIILLQDLMTKHKQRYRWLICGIVVIVVLALVIAAAILLTGGPDSAASRANSAPGISLEEWLSGSLSPKSFNGTWISGKYHAFVFIPKFLSTFRVARKATCTHRGFYFASRIRLSKWVLFGTPRSRSLINSLFKRIEAHRANNARFNASNVAGYMEEVRS